MSLENDQEFYKTNADILNRINDLYNQRDPRIPMKPWDRTASPGHYIGEGWGAPEPVEFRQWTERCIAILNEVP